MPSSNRTAQLKLWREIVSKRHEVNKPVNRHIDFIQRRFDQLDSEGFVWSKDSILGIILQLSLPEGKHGTFSSVNDIVESRVLLGFETSSHGIKEVIQIEELRHKRLGLMDLPLEVFNNIISMLNSMAKLEGDKLERRKRRSTVVISNSGHKKPYLTYLHRHSPVLNSIQTFSLASREIYELCRPWLWQKLHFPTRLQAPIDLWTEEILLKQGSLVRTLELSLGENCSLPDGVEERDPFYDNLTIDMEDDHERECVSPKNAKDLITRCPNLSELEIRYELIGDQEDADQVSRFLSDLSPLIGRLKQLRQLSFVCYMDLGPAIKFPSKLILDLPLLESLKCREMVVLSNEGRIGNASFGSDLSKLRHLSTLQLIDIEGIDEHWCLYDWPKTITNLTIHSCGNLSPSSTYKIIHHIAPCLTNLWLGFEKGDGIWEIDPNWNPGYRFSLPSLADLRLCTRNAYLLESFQDCKSLMCLDWDYVKLEHCRALSGILFRAPWPQLKKLAVRTFWTSQEARDPRDQEIEAELVSLEKYCEQAYIKAEIQRRRLD